MDKVTTIGIDLAKNVFQVHGIDAAGQVVLRRKLRRGEVEGFFAALPPCTIGMEACGTAHFRARALGRLGHEVRLMPPAYVKPYVKRGKTDAADAEAICEAVTRPTMRFVPAKTEAQQAGLVELRVRDLLVRQRTQAVNALRGHLAEFGVVAPKGVWKVAELLAVIRDRDDHRLPASARMALTELAEELDALQARIERLETGLVRRARTDATARRLATIPGIGAITANALLALVPDPQGFASGRHFAAWLGLTPRAHSSGGKERLGRISKQGNTMLRTLLIRGATAQLQYVRRSPEGGGSGWLADLLARRPFKVAAVALANKMARIAWALLAKGGIYRTPAAA
jgi:transposase